MLAKYFRRVILNDMCRNLTEAWNDVKQTAMSKYGCLVDEFHVCMAHEIRLSNPGLDLIFTSWCLGYYDDDEAKNLLRIFHRFLHRDDHTFGIYITKETTRP